jgi:predicted nicotinamide N-methyase
MPGYQTKQESIVIAGAANLLIRSLLDRQQFSDPQGDAERLGISSAAWPIFGVLWPSGALLAARMATHVLAPGARILEVGCGLALASLVGHRRGADITASDRHPLAAPFLAHNLRLNALPPMTYCHGDWAPQQSAPALEGAAGVAGALQRYELIIGSDVLYDRDASAALAGFIVRHAMPQAEVWIVDPNRGNRAGFSARLAQAGFTLVEAQLHQLAHGDNAAYRGRMLTYSRTG